MEQYVAGVMGLLCRLDVIAHPADGDADVPRRQRIQAVQDGGEADEILLLHLAVRPVQHRPADDLWRGVQVAVHPWAFELTEPQASPLTDTVLSVHPDRGALVIRLARFTVHVRSDARHLFS